MPKHREIDWAWLLQTTPNTRGSLPGQAVLFKHVGAQDPTPEQIYVLDGERCYRIAQKADGSWTKPVRVDDQVFYHLRGLPAYQEPHD